MGRRERVRDYRTPAIRETNLSGTLSRSGVLLVTDLLNSFAQGVSTFSSGMPTSMIFVKENTRDMMLVPRRLKLPISLLRVLRPCTFKRASSLRSILSSEWPSFLLCLCFGWFRLAELSMLLNPGRAKSPKADTGRSSGGFLGLVRHVIELSAVGELPLGRDDASVGEEHVDGPVGCAIEYVLPSGQVSRQSGGKKVWTEMWEMWETWARFGRKT